MPELSPEYVEVELPFIQQLQAMGWDYLPGDTGVPYLTEREDFRQVLLTSRLHEALQRINLDESGQPWLDDARVNQAMGHLERLGKPKLIEANRVATELLIKGTQVESPDGKNVTVSRRTKARRHSSSSRACCSPDSMRPSSKSCTWTARLMAMSCSRPSLV